MLSLPRLPLDLCLLVGIDSSSNYSLVCSLVSTILFALLFYTFLMAVLICYSDCSSYAPSSYAILSASYLKFLLKAVTH